MFSFRLKAEFTSELADNLLAPTIYYRRNFQIIETKWANSFKNLSPKQLKLFLMVCVKTAVL